MASDGECGSVVSLNVDRRARGRCRPSRHGGRPAPVLQNRELTALVQDGFTGKPLSDDPNDPQSSVWTGELTDGSRIVAVFNRESQPLEYTLTPSELGFTSGVVRDLWEHRNLPQQSSYESTFRCTTASS